MGGFKFRITTGAFFVLPAMLFTVPVDRLINMGIAVCVHEVGHIIAIVLAGGKIQCIIVGVGGFTIITGGKLLSNIRECIVALSGIFANIICFSVCALFGAFDNFRLFCLLFAVLNSIPVVGFDTYRALECIFFEKQALLSIISGFSLFLMWVFSVYILFVYPSNPTLFILCASVYLGSCGKSRENG